MGWGKHKIDLDELVKLYKSGMSYVDMAKNFNCTNGGISFQLQKLKRQGIIEHRRVSIKEVKKKRIIPRTFVDTTLAWKTLKVKQVEWNYVSETGKTIMDLKNNDCRWPCNGGLYCGKISVTGKSYCEEHQRISEGNNGRQDK